LDPVGQCAAYSGLHRQRGQSKQAHDFAKAVLQYAKTNQLDAKMLATLGAKLTPPPWTPPPAIYQQLQQRLAWRDSLVHLRTQVQNQHHALLQEAVVVDAVEQRQQALSADLTAQIAAVSANCTMCSRGRGDGVSGLSVAPLAIRQ
jgi:transposase